MPYIGKQLVRGQNRKLDDISSGFNGSQTTFTLQVASQNVTVGSALQLWISLGGVIQEPTIDYTIAGNQITFTTAPAASLDFFGVIQGDVTDTNTPGDATVTTSKLTTGLTVNLADGSAATSSLQLGGTDSGLFSSAADKVNVTTGGVERLEIGDSEVVFNDPSNDVDFRVESNGNANMLFVDGGNDRVGIGKTPATYNLEVNGGTANTVASFESTDATARILFKDNSGEAMVGATGDELTFYTTTSATERMRIDSSGRLLIGTTSARGVGHGTAGAFEIEGTSATVFTSIVKNSADQYGGSIALGKSRGTSVGANTAVQSGDELGSIRFAGADGTDVQTRAAQITAAVDGTPGSNDMPGRLVFSTTADGASNPTERVRINSSGDVGIGNSSPHNSSGFNTLTIGNGTSTGGQLKLENASGNDFYIWHDSNGANIYNTSATSQIFYTNATERMRLGTTGTLCIGRTDSVVGTNKLSLQGDGTNTIVGVQTGTSTGTVNFAQFFASTTSCGGIAVNGTTGSTSYITTSDYRLKENIVDITGAIARLNNLAPKRFNFIHDTTQTTLDGFIAHEVQSVVPEAIVGDHNEVDDDNNPVYQGIDQSKLVPLLTAALQEAIAKIETLETKVAALEAE